MAVTILDEGIAVVNVNVHEPDPPDRVALHKVETPFRTVTVPVAVKGYTVEVYITNWPTVAVFGNAVTEVVVLISGV